MLRKYFLFSCLGAACTGTMSFLVATAKLHMQDQTPFEGWLFVFALTSFGVAVLAWIGAAAAAASNSSAVRALTERNLVICAVVTGALVSVAYQFDLGSPAWPDVLFLLLSISMSGVISWLVLSGARRLVGA